MRYRDLIEAITPAYGYWVTPDGTIIPVPKDHDNTSREHGLSVNEALDAGWVRVVAGDVYRNGEFAIDYVDGTLTRQSRSGIRRLARDVEPKVYAIHHHGVPGLATFDLLSPFLQAIR